MNKLVTVLGVAAVATLAGCKDPNYKPFSTYSTDEVKVVEPTHVPPPVDLTPVTCKCAPGTKHTSPCTCGAPDCKCVVEVKPLPPPPPPPPAKVTPPEPEYTVYIVQNGDYLAKISKKYNITISSIKQLNGLKNDTIRVGQKLKLPGKVDVGVQKEPAKVTAAKKTAVKGATEYTGETKEYVVKSGDTLGAIAYGNGCNIRQLKKLNGLTSDSLKIGQKLKVPAGKAAAPAEKKAEAQPKPVEKPVEPVVAPAAPVVEPTAPTTVPEPVPEPVVEDDEPAAPAVPAEAPAATYTVQEGDDITGITIRYGVSAASIRELNGLPEGAQLTVGQVIKLPADAQL